MKLLCLSLVVSIGLVFASVAVSDPILKTSFPLTPTPGTLVIPGGGFTLGQTFSFDHIWDNTWDLPVKVTFKVNLTELDTASPNDEFPFTGMFTLPALSVGNVFTRFMTLTATQLNSADDLLELSPLEFQVDGPEFTFTHIPEPSTWILLGIGVLGIFGMGYRQRKRAA